MALVPREDCAKTVLHGASPRGAGRGQGEGWRSPRGAGRGQDEDWSSRVLGSMLVSCLCSLAQAEAEMECARPLLRVRLGHGL